MEHLYFHGTSSLFLRSIVKYGLGGININEEFRLLELLHFLHKLAEDYLIGEEDYNIIRDSTKAMVFQEPLLINDGNHKGYHNFNHKHIYLSYGMFRAMVYAVDTEYGSEILSRIISLYRILKKRLNSVTIPTKLNRMEIEKIEKQTFFPLLIGLDNVNVKHLQTEYGDSVYKSLYEIQKKRQLYDYETFWESVQFYNFRLLKPIPRSQLTFYKILYSGSPKELGFRWTKFKI